MRMFRLLLPALPVIIAAVLLGASPAFAGAPAAGTVRIEGVSQTLLPATTVTTSTVPVVNDGNPEHSCEGTSALGALQVATSGNWLGVWSESAEFGNQYFINAIDGETHLYSFGSLSYYWSFWLNDVESSLGACQVKFEAGDRVLFFPKCDELCPEGAELIGPLEIEAPATAGAGETVNVTVRRYTKSGEPSPAAGASVVWSGGSTKTDPEGHASITFAGAGEVEVHVTGAATGPPSMRTETSVCVHNGDDGTCGTKEPETATAPPSGGDRFTPVYRGPYAVVSRITNLTDGHVYDRRHAPRLLAGAVTAHVGVTAVRLELRRSYRGRCYFYDGVVGAFRRSRCGHGSFFVVSHTPSFSYLLPAALAPGRYVLDTHASDVAGNQSTLARGTTRIVFYVR